METVSSRVCVCNCVLDRADWFKLKVYSTGCHFMILCVCVCVDKLLTLSWKSD